MLRRDTIMGPGRVELPLASLEWLIERAYRLEAYQISGPDWMKTVRFDIAAKIPDGASVEQVPEMLQSLLEERFKLAVHHESREQSIYALMVAKDGLKLKEWDPGAPRKPAPDRIFQKVQSDDGPRFYSSINGRVVFRADKIKLADLASTLMSYVDDPVVDVTGLMGYYEVTLEVPGGPGVKASPALAARARASGLDVPDPSDPSGVSIFASVRKVGLTLDRRKGPVEHLVVDHLEKTPTDN